MRTRVGFISNSSSSSFIVAIDKEKTNGIIEVAVKVNLADFGDVLTTEKEVLDAFIEEYGEEELEDEWVADKYHKAIDAIKAGKAILLGRVSNEDTPEEIVIYEKGIPETEGIEIIQNVDY